MRSVAWSLGLAAAVLVVGAGVVGAAEEGALKEGDLAPVFTGRVLNPDVAGVKQVALDQVVGGTAQPAKKALILSFFATYCEPCKKELPYLQALHEKYKDQGLGVMVVSIDQKPEDIAKVSELVKEKGVTYPVLSDRFNIVAKRYSVKRLPCLYMLDGTGKITMASTGYSEEFSGELLAAVQNRLGVPVDPAAVPHAVAAAPAPAAEQTPANTVEPQPEQQKAGAEDKKVKGKKKKGK
ncbi:MAG: TlpA disulfide reductase family protein [Myxococcota bacterium]